MAESTFKNPLAKLFTLEFLISWTLIVFTAGGIYFAMKAKAEEANKTAGESLQLARAVHEYQQDLKLDIERLKLQIQNTDKNIVESSQRTNKRLDTQSDKLDRLLER